MSNQGALQPEHDKQTGLVMQSSAHRPAIGNAALLDEVNAGSAWFHARKTRPIWAQMVMERQIVRTLEGEAEVEVGNYLCRGEAGDIWPQTERDLLKRYTISDEIDHQGWRKYLPNPDAQGVMAVPISHPFSVQTSWGILTGKPGDYLLKNFSDRDTPYPADVWIVDRSLFHQTYQANP